MNTDLDLTWKTIKRAIEITDGKDSSALEVQARFFFQLGMVEEAVSVQQEAIKHSLDRQDELRAMLDFYEKVIKIRKKIKKKLTYQ